ncbi:CoA ester lyase [Sphingobium aquiterrae]|uniref:HpcH/HpaI aldolase/citrate lyase family protein n=1 Tax=Sphingobium aquiterrae TaxID=2038656 RepID=UPI003018DA54
MTHWRSLLFVPADNDARCAKAARAGADAVVLDLEDGVGAGAKENARGKLPAAVAAVRAGGSAVVVRINGPWALAVEDIRVAAQCGVDALMVPKAEDSNRLEVIAEMAAEWAGGCAPGLIALVETPRGIAALTDIVRVPAVMGLALGTEDFSLALGVPPGAAALDLPSRRIALAAAERGMMALAVPLSIAQFRDIDAYSAAARHGAAYSVNGAICIHPAQVGAANACFGATPAEHAEARRIIAAWEDALAAGLSVTALDGMMIDLPVAERAKRLLSRPLDAAGKGS